MNALRKTNLILRYPGAFGQRVRTTQSKPKEKDSTSKADPPKKAPPPPPKAPAAPAAPVELKPQIKTVVLYRFNPSTPQIKAHAQTIKFDMNLMMGMAPMVLTALITIKEKIDGTLTFRRSCREGICGSCSMNIDGLNCLACITQVNPDLSKPLKIYPLPHLYVLRDLVPDMDHFYRQYKIIEPWLKRK